MDFRPMETKTSQILILFVGPSLPSSQTAKQIWPEGRSKEFFDKVSASLFSSQRMCLKARFLYNKAASLVLSFQLPRTATWKSTRPFNQSMISFESPRSIMSSVYLLAKTRETQAPTSSAFVFDLMPQFKVHRILEWELKTIFPPAPQSVPPFWEAPSNQATVLSVGISKAGRLVGEVFITGLWLVASARISFVILEEEGFFSWKSSSFLAFQTRQQRWIRVKLCVLFSLNQIHIQSWILEPDQGKVIFSTDWRPVQITLMKGQLKNTWSDDSLADL